MEQKSTQRRALVILSAVLSTVNEIPDSPSTALYVGLVEGYQVTLDEYAYYMSFLEVKGLITVKNYIVNLTAAGKEKANAIDAIIAKKRDATGDNVPYAGEDGGTASVKRQDAELRRMIGEGS